MSGSAQIAAAAEKSHPREDAEGQRDCLTHLTKSGERKLQETRHLPAPAAAHPGVSLRVQRCVIGKLIIIDLTATALLLFPI